MATARNLCEEDEDGAAAETERSGRLDLAEGHHARPVTNEEVFL
jgi:hypothetical protein